MHGGFFGWSGLKPGYGRADVNFNYCIRWDCGGATVGILLALGRRSHMPIVRILSVIFIEFWRGAPLITVLFMSSVMLPLFMAEGTNIDKLIRALVGVILFQSAYVAEVVRGGLQALPKGQYEAAESLALGYWKTQGLVILPQALKLVIPGWEYHHRTLQRYQPGDHYRVVRSFSSVQQATVDSTCWVCRRKGMFSPR